MLSALTFLLAADPAITTNFEDERPIEVITLEASKRPISATELAATVTVIDQARIERELVQNISDLVRYEPGVDVPDQGSRFGFGGFTIRGIGGNRVRTEIDGVAASDAFSIGSFSNAGRDFIDIRSIKQMEIIRGPGSAMFGSNAIGGVVSFVTKQPGDYLGDRDSYLDVNAGYNSVDSSAVAGFTGALRTGGVESLLLVTRREGGERDFSGADPLNSESTNVLGKLQFGDASSGGFGVTLDYFLAESETDVLSLQGTRDFTADLGFPYVITTSDVNGDDRRERFRASVGQEWVDGIGGTDYFRWRMFWQSSETTQQTFEAVQTFIAGRASAAERSRDFRFEQDLAGIEINALNDVDWLGLNHEIAYGLEYEQAETTQIRDGVEVDLATGTVSSRVGPDVLPVRDFPASTSSSLGLYVQDRIEIGAVTLIPGLRWDRFDINPEADAIFLADNPGIQPVGLTEDRLSPKFGVLVDLSSAWQVYGQYAEGFRAPPVNDVNVGFTNLEFGYTALPNGDLRAETSRGVELGLRFNSRKASIDLAAFRTRYDDFIESLRPVGFDSVRQLLTFQSVNIDEVEIDGVEVRGRWSPDLLPEGMSLHASAAWSEGVNENTGAPINSIAPLNGVLGVDFAEPSGRWGGSLLARAAAAPDDLDESGGEVLRPSGYVVYDAIAFWQPASRLRVSGGIYNLADREYTAYLDVQGVTADVANPDRFQRPGRNLSVVLDWVF